MAIRLIKYCDGHLEALEQEVLGETIPPVTMPNGKSKVVDLCEECQTTVAYATLIDLLEEYGRDVDSEKRVIKATPQKQEIPEEERSQCRFCDRNDFRLQGRKMHETRTHPEELAALMKKEREDKQAAAERGDITVPDNLEDLDSFCEVCNQQLSSPQALEQHKNTRKHKNKATEAVDA